MTEPTMQETLNRLLKNLKSGDAACQLEALRELGTINFTSEAVVLQVEKLALGENEEVRAAALDALDLKTSQLMASKLTSIKMNIRQVILEEIESWKEDGLIEPYRAETLMRRYDFDIKPGRPTQAAPVEAAATETVEEAPARPIPAPAPLPPTPAQSPAPRTSLMQVLLSETSIKIYLYLGAFFVIAAAAILAALVEAARLTVLLAATLAFAAGAVGLRKRLPQPSFALAVVFSFLLPIDANVFADSLSLSPRANEIYWMLVFLLMAVIWGFGTRLHASRLFSAAAFLSLLLAALRFGEIFDARAGWSALPVAAASLLGLLGMFALKKWRNGKFILPVFLLAQLVQPILLFASFVSTLSVMIGGADRSGDWLAAALTWLLAASFYAASDLLVPFFLFPWMAAASLFLLPWLVLSAFDASSPALLAGFALWGALAAFASEFVRRTGRAALTKYHFPLLALSLPLFLTAIFIGFNESAQLGLAAFLGAGIVYTLAHILRPRWYVWMAALLAGLGAYFTFFALPFMDEADIAIEFILLGASLILLIPELFFKEPLSFLRAWNWPPVMLGIALAALNILIAVIESDDKSAVVFAVTAILSAGYALRFRRPHIGYLGTASAALSVIYTLQHFDHDGWLPALTALAVVYYAAGFLLARREQAKSWGAMFIYSGFALGVILSLVAVFTLKATGGWYALVIAALFIVEMFTRKNGWLELFTESLLSIALIVILNDFNVTEFAYTFFGLALLWFACDAVFALTFPSRNASLAAKVIGGLLAIASVPIIAGELTSSAAAFCFAVYAVFFAVYAWLHKIPPFGYASTASLALTVYFGASAMNVDNWLFLQIGLAVLFYAAGFLLRRADKAKGWDAMFLFSGLGLGTFTALLAPFTTGGPENAIPIAAAATIYAAEAFARKNVWLGFPANILYLIAWFTLLNKLNVEEPQFYSVGAAALGLLQHYLLRRAGSKTASFITGLVSQLVLLGTSYIQMVDTGELKYFFLLFFQSLAVLAYGVVVRSRSLVIAPISFAVLAVLTILYNALKDLSLVFIIGITGIILLTLGILAVVMRERITAWAERFGDWEA